MNFRRIPFKFEASDPVQRHSELMRRFGTSDDRMFVETPIMPDCGFSSPGFSRRQLNDFGDGMTNQRLADHKPSVRVIPIQVEGDPDDHADRLLNGSKVDSSPLRSRSTPQANDGNHQCGIGGSSIKVKLPEAQSCPDVPGRVRNIPIAVEREGCSNVQAGCEEQTLTPDAPKAASKRRKTPTNSGKSAKNQQVFKQIDEVMKEFQHFKIQVDDFTSTQKDKQFFYLDEMLLRCILKLDNIETNGNIEARSARKAAVNEVQNYINILESKTDPETSLKTLEEPLAQDAAPSTEALPELEAEMKESSIEAESSAEEMEISKENVCDPTQDSNQSVTTNSNEFNEQTSELVPQSSESLDKGVPIPSDIEAKVSQKEEPNEDRKLVKNAPSIPAEPVNKV